MAESSLKPRRWFRRLKDKVTRKNTPASTSKNDVSEIAINVAGPGRQASGISSPSAPATAPTPMVIKRPIATFGPPQTSPAPGRLITTNSAMLARMKPMLYRYEPGCTAPSGTRVGVDGINATEGRQPQGKPGQPGATTKTETSGSVANNGGRERHSPPDANSDTAPGSSIAKSSYYGVPGHRPGDPKKCYMCLGYLDYGPTRLGEMCRCRDER